MVGSELLCIKHVLVISLAGRKVMLRIIGLHVDFLVQTSLSMSAAANLQSTHSAHRTEQVS